MDVLLQGKTRHTAMRETIASRYFEKGKGMYRKAVEVTGCEDGYSKDASMTRATWNGAMFGRRSCWSHRALIELETTRWRERRALALPALKRLYYNPDMYLPYMGTVVSLRLYVMALAVPSTTRRCRVSPASAHPSTPTHPHHD